MRDRSFGQPRLRFVHRSRVAEGELVSVRRTTVAGGSDELTIELAQLRSAEVNTLRAGTSGLTRIVARPGSVAATAAAEAAA